MTSKLPGPESREPPAPLVGYRGNAEWQDLLAQFAVIAEEIEAIEDDAVRDKVLAVLQITDAIHREALHRLVRLFKDGVLEQVVTDPAIHTLMGMYDLLPTPGPTRAKVWDFIADAPSSPAVAAPVAAREPADLPRWTSLAHGAKPSDGEAIVLDVEDRAIVCAGVDGQHFAVNANCPTHGVVMSAGRLSGYSWICPAGPGCVYDIRNGSRLGGGRGLTCYSVRATSDRDGLQIGFGMPFTPRLPAF